MRPEFKVVSEERKAKIVPQKCNKIFNVVCNQQWHKNGAYTVTYLARDVPYHDAAQIRHEFNSKLGL